MPATLTRAQRVRLVATRGWQALPQEDQEWLDTLYWGDPGPWPAGVALFHTDPMGSEAEPDLAVPSLGDGRSSVRIAPIVRGHTDPEPGTTYRFQHFLRFWRWWIERRPEVVKDGGIALAHDQLGGAPLIKVVPASAQTLKRRFVARLIEEARHAPAGPE